jgi:hypothetical protein
MQQKERRANGGSLWAAGDPSRGGVRGYAAPRANASSATTRLSVDARGKPKPLTVVAKTVASTEPASLGSGPSLSVKPEASAIGGAGPSKQPSRARPSSARRRGLSSSARTEPVVAADTAKWTVEEVCLWLSSVGLGSYTDKFTENAISGDVLLELGKDDLDYMGIKALGHRKLLLKGVASLRQNAGMTVDPSQLGSPSGKVHWSESASLMEAGAEQVRREAEAASRPRVQILTEAEARAQGLQIGPDTDSESAAFREAILAWRKGGDVDSSGGGMGAETGGGDGMWVNPFAGPGHDTVKRDAAKPDSETASWEEQEHRAFEQAVLDWREGRQASERASCFQCFKTFELVPGRFVEVTDPDSQWMMVHRFCSQACADRHARAGAERRSVAERATATPTSLEPRPTVVEEPPSDENNNNNSGGMDHHSDEDAEPPSASGFDLVSFARAAEAAGEVAAAPASRGGVTARERTLEDVVREAETRASRDLWDAELVGY